MHSDETITTADEFNESLNDLMRTAYENGVDVEGGWSVGTGPRTPIGTS